MHRAGAECCRSTRHQHHAPLHIAPLHPFTPHLHDAPLHTPYRGMPIAIAFDMGVERYEDLLAWQLANELKIRVYELVDNSPARSDRKFSDQIKDAASSGPRNLSEGFGSYGHGNFARYTRIARSSLIETHNHVKDGADRGYWSHEIAAKHQKLADRAIGATTRLLHHLVTTDAPSSWRKR